MIFMLNQLNFFETMNFEEKKVYKVHFLGLIRFNENLKQDILNNVEKINKFKKGNEINLIINEEFDDVDYFILPEESEYSLLFYYSACCKGIILKENWYNDSSLLNQWIFNDEIKKYYFEYPGLESKIFKKTFYCSIPILL